jgi:hypothetical protein
MQPTASRGKRQEPSQPLRGRKICSHDGLSSRPKPLMPEGDAKQSGGTCCFAQTTAIPAQRTRKAGPPAYVALEPSDLYRYVDEQVFRYNRRGTNDAPTTDGDRFELAYCRSRETSSEARFFAVSPPASGVKLSLDRGVWDR